MLGLNGGTNSVRVAIALLAATVVWGVGARPAAAVSWSNPHHAYVVFLDLHTHIPYVQEISVDPSPGSTMTLGGSNTGFCVINALAIGPQGNLYVSGAFGSNCQAATAGIEIFAPGANGNVPPIAMIAGPQTALSGPSGMAFDASGRLYVTQEKGRKLGDTGEIVIFAAGATGNAAPVGAISGPKTQLRFKVIQYVAVDDAGEIFAGCRGGNWILKYAAGASGNVAPLVLVQLQPTDASFNEMQVSGTTIYAALGALKNQISEIDELSTENLSITRTLTHPHFRILSADADRSGKVYVQDFIRQRNGESRGRLYEFASGHQQPGRVRRDGLALPGGYIVVGP